MVFGGVKKLQEVDKIIDIFLSFEIYFQLKKN